VSVALIQIPRYKIIYHRLSENFFWANKVSMAKTFDMIVLGDSRTLHAIDISQISPNGLNYAFLSNTYTTEYLESAINKLKSSGSKIVLIGLSAQSLTNYQADKSFQLYFQESNQLLFFQKFKLALNEIIPTLNLNQLLRGRLNLNYKSFQLQRIFHENGWVETVSSPPKITSNMLSQYTQSFNNFNIDQRIILSLIKFIKTSSSDGYQFYFFWTPTSKELTALEQRIVWNRYDKTTLNQQLQQAGAKKIMLDEYDYQTYDGDHLDSEEAKYLSREIARKLGSPIRVIP
jgi:hypothetical protein